jgi:hypothetical protein
MYPPHCKGLCLLVLVLAWAVLAAAWPLPTPAAALGDFPAAVAADPPPVDEETEEALIGFDPAAAEATWFPLTLPWDDATATLVDASDLLGDRPGDDLSTVIDRRGFVVTDAEGHLRFSRTGRRARFWGTNLTFRAVLPPSPSHPPAAGEFPDARGAEKLAARLAKLGFNAVRLHMFDWMGRPDGIWLNPDANTQIMDPVSLARLDYLIYQLKRRGIYIALDLHSGRHFALGDGVTDAPEFKEAFLAGGVGFNKGATHFDPIMIALQRDYAARLLNHVNPYTGLAYKDDPVILFTETTNEDSLFTSWVLDQLHHWPGDESSFPAFSSLELDGWTRAAGSGPRINRLRNPGFEGGLGDWFTFTTGSARATFGTDSNAYRGSKALKVNVTQVSGTAWHIQFGQDNLAVQAGKTYRIRFAARASTNTSVQAMIRRNGEPWNALGWQTTLQLTPTWQRYEFTFTATETLFGGARLSFDVGQAVRTLWFDDFLFQETDAFPGWLGWLENRYGSTAALRAAWAPSGTAPETEKVVNGSFETGLTPWASYVEAPAAAGFQIDTTTAAHGSRSLRAQVTAVDGTDWHVQISQGALSVTAGQLYRLRFAAKASSPGPFVVLVMQNHDPWQLLGLVEEVNPGTNWQTFEFLFTATAGEANARIGFSLGQKVRTIWIDNVSLKPVNAIGLRADESLEGNNVARIRRHEMSQYTPQRLRDTLAFYEETQRVYLTGMRNYLRTNLGARALNIGSTSIVNSLADIYTFAQLDAVDSHLYWDHPTWPNAPAWSPVGWVIHNQPWVNSPLEGLFDLAAMAVQGKPFTVTEFNQPFPNRYAVEAPLLMATFANWQDWDAVFQFAYADGTFYNSAYASSFFDLVGNPVATGLMPVAARLFLGGQTAAAPTTSLLRYTANERYDSMRFDGIGAFLQEAKGVHPAAAFGSRLRIGDFNAPAPVTPNLPTPSGPVYRSADGQLRWDVSQPNRGMYSFNAPQAQGVVGFLAGRSITLGNLSLSTPTNTAAFAAVVAQSRDGRPLATAQTVLLSVFTRVENTGQVWNADHTSLDDRWGRPPTLIEPFRTTITLQLSNPAAVQVWALDETGAPRQRLSTRVLSGRRLRFTVDTAVHKTMWYALQRTSLAPLEGEEPLFLPRLQQNRPAP